MYLPTTIALSQAEGHILHHDVVVWALLCAKCAFAAYSFTHFRQNFGLQFYYVDDQRIELRNWIRVTNSCIYHIAILAEATSSANRY